MRILLTNDDGIHAPGLRAMARALSRLGTVDVVAPAVEQSGIGLAITFLHPIMVHEEFRDGERFGWAVAGSPADCVKLGILEFCQSPPDLVVSGINDGANVGINVLYSGTVAAAIEGAFFGVTSVAVSQATDEPADFARTADQATDLIARLIDRRPPAGSLWNINFPSQSPGIPRGVKLTAMGVRRHRDVMEKRHDPRGRPYYWSGLDPLDNHQQDPGTDVRELADGYVTISPLHFDLTRSSLLEEWADVEWDT